MNSSSAKILLVDNDEDNLFILTFILMQDGYQVISAGSPPLMQEVAEMAPDLIILDELLGKYRGSEFCRLLKADDQMAIIPVLLLSAMSGLPQVASACNADAYIEKPYELNELEKKVKDLLFRT